MVNHNFCFSILALNLKYQLLAKELAEDIKKYSPETSVVIGTDNPDIFSDCRNVLAFKMEKRGILHCYHDKRFVIQEALKKFKIVIQIDADTRIDNPLPESFEPSTGLAAIHVENSIEHTKKYNPERLKSLHKLAKKLSLDLETISYVGEALFAIVGEEEQTLEFIRYWDAIARYLELRGIHAGEGHAIGLAAAKVGLEIGKPSWLKNIHKAKRHLRAASASDSKPKNILWNNSIRRINYHYRLNKARILALKDFDFYYR
ncbi:MAG: hypothetical protein J7647_04810 [Cyanobacteria bacterium SBLK]|nr:hypothetical protein [Cyanobacteria bacterium SBLK]